MRLHRKSIETFDLHAFNSFNTQWAFFFLLSANEIHWRHSCVLMGHQMKCVVVIFLFFFYYFFFSPFSLTFFFVSNARLLFCSAYVCNVVYKINKHQIPSPGWLLMKTFFIHLARIYSIAKINNKDTHTQT